MVEDVLKYAGYRVRSGDYLSVTPPLGLSREPTNNDLDL